MWAIDQVTGAGPMSYLSGYGGQRFFTLGQPRMVIDVNGTVRKTVIHSTYTVASAQNIVINFGTLRTSTGSGVVNGTSLLTLNPGTFTNSSGAALVLQVSYSVYFPSGQIQVWIKF